MLGRALYLTRRFLKEGPRLSWWKYQVSPLIQRWENPWAERPKQDVPLHVVGGHEHRWMAGWMLASFFQATQTNWPVVWHDDGTGTKAFFHWLRTAFDAEIVLRADANARIAPLLADKPLCRDYRRDTPLALKCLDVPALAKTERFLLFDPDVLFFQEPDKILQWVETKDDPDAWFNADFQEPSLISPEDARSDLGITLWPRVNSGLCLLRRELANFDRFEPWMAQPSMKAGHFWRKEQTLWALAASQRNLGGTLPGAYEVSASAHARPDAVARHYVGLVRDRFFLEGLKKLYNLLT